MIKRLIHWYTGVTEYELVLDSKDYEYQRYGGGRVDEVGTAYLAQLNTTFTEIFQFQPLLEKISILYGSKGAFTSSLDFSSLNSSKGFSFVLLFQSSPLAKGKTV